MHKSIGKTLLVGGLVITSLVSQVGAVVAAPSDISESKFREHIENLIAANVVSGYSDGTFRPSNNVTRGEMAKFIVNAFNLGVNGNVQQFPDVPSTNPFFTYINILKTEGIVSGYSDGTYRPNAYVTRGETAKFIHNALKKTFLGIDIGADVVSPFSDVHSDNVFRSPIIFLSKQNIINGFSDGTFKPSNNVTRGEMAKMVDGGRNKYLGVKINNAIDLNKVISKYTTVRVTGGEGLSSKYIINSVGEVRTLECSACSFKKIENNNGTYRYTIDGVNWIVGLPSDFPNIETVLEKNLPKAYSSFVPREDVEGWGKYKDSVRIVDKVMDESQVYIHFGPEYTNFQKENGPFYQLERLQGELCLDGIQGNEREGDCRWSWWYFDKNLKLVYSSTSSVKQLYTY